MPSLSAFDLTPSQAACREWLLPCGTGGFASSTAIGMNTRKYHGLLVAPIAGGQNRHVMLSKFEETAKTGGAEYPLSTNTYPGVVYPEGFRHLVGFSFDSHPLFAYSLGGARLEKSVRMPHGKNTVVVSYRLASGREAELKVRPLLAPRPMHSDPSASGPQLQPEADRLGFSIAKPAAMRVSASAGSFHPSPEKYRNMEYRAEKERGYPYSETLASPGHFSATLEKGDELHIAASLEGLSASEALDLLDRQNARFSHLAAGFARQNGFERTDFSDTLVRAADSFVFSRNGSHGLLAGFHWFSEWGRDANVALPGILLCTGRHALAFEILSQQPGMMREGLLPNFIDENGQAHYNSADASLWFVNAVREYVDYTNDYWSVQQGLWKPLRSFLSSYVQGNSLVGMDSDCLLEVLEPAATWMDAKINGVAVTARRGKPVEINALWYSDLHFLRSLAERFDDKRTESVIAPIIETIGSSFQKFLSAEDGRLLDVLEPADSSLRPNQVFALSLPHSPLNELQKKHVFNIVRSRLYTPFGLRTLSPDDPRYHERYSGNQEERDSAYHQGAIWPWLLGAFYEAQLRIYPGSERAVLGSLRPLAEAMSKGCIGSLPELYEPATLEPRGAISQAWSVAEVLRIYAKVKRGISEKQEISAEKSRMIA
ncbi:Amylo-alpha-1,6-glucosidase [uncultured archaeon]|nr:Amylo-alpha-1,6-glucosidase [uncultured archaeon]